MAKLTFLLTILNVWVAYVYVYVIQTVHGHVGYPCLQESDCVDTMPHSTCTGIDQSNKTCECTNGFQASRGDIVCTPVLGASCNNDADCHELEFGECHSHVCQCEISKVADENECKVKIKGRCTTDIECPTNATCEESICKCVDTYVTDRDKCKSSAMPLKVSWLLMIAALAMALLYTTK